MSRLSTKLIQPLFKNGRFANPFPTYEGQSMLHSTTILLMFFYNCCYPSSQSIISIHYLNPFLNSIHIPYSKYCFYQLNLYLNSELMQHLRWTWGRKNTKAPHPLVKDLHEALLLPPSSATRDTVSYNTSILHVLFSSLFASI